MDRRWIHWLGKKNKATCRYNFNVDNQPTTKEVEIPTLAPPKLRARRRKRIHLRNKSISSPLFVTLVPLTMRARSSLQCFPIYFNKSSEMSGQYSHPYWIDMVREDVDYISIGEVVAFFVIQSSKIRIFPICFIALFNDCLCQYVDKKCIN